jgi:lipopolysaccharide transport system ATP-binding protein
MTTAIAVQNLGKCYKVDHLETRGGYRTLREALSEGVGSVVNRLRRKGKARITQEFWALKDLDFEVKAGEVVGIIGRNGAGKSTLLKILSRITKPTTGEVEIHGTVSSLLEVGTGFHPELTGRENIYLNGAVLGMARREIDRKFDDIVAFSEIDRFLDTPVKRYSSGMSVRLAFSVAAHLEPSVLVVDEVLAVGDASFQKKCIGQMGNLAREGRTILFVSHDMNAIAKLTRSAILLEKGHFVMQGRTDEVVRSYLSMDERVESEAEWEQPGNATPKTKVAIRSVRSRRADGLTTSHFRADEAIHIEIVVGVSADSEAQIAFRLNRNDDGTTVFTSALSDEVGERSTRLAPGVYEACCEVPGPLLTPGSYHLLVAANNPKGPQHDMVERVLNFEVSEIGSPRSHDRRLGFVTPILPWTIAKVGVDSISRRRSLERDSRP